MELRHLRYFQAVAEALNFSRAAEKLRVAQPALSRQIQALEAELGVPLFVRNRVRVELTDAGRVLQTHAGRLLAQLEIATTAVQAVAAGNTGELTLCNDWRLAVGAVPESVGEFRRRHPRAEVVMRDIPLHEQLPALHARKVHLVFVPRDYLGSGRDTESFPILESAILALLPKQHPLAKRPRLRLADLAGETFAHVDAPGKGHRNWVTQLCRLAGFTPRFGRSARSIEGVSALVTAGFGITLAPEFMRPRGSRSLRAVATDCEPLQLCAAWRRDDDSKLLQNFLAVLREQVAEDAG